MNIQEMAKKIEKSQQRLNFISGRADQLLLHPELLKAAFEELSISLEELEVQQEELYAQSEELINSRKQLELEHKRYQELFKFAPDAYLVTDIRGVIQEANQAAEELFKVPWDFMVDKPLIVFVVKQNYDNFHTQLDQLSKVEKVKDWEIVMKPKRGQPFPVNITVSNIYDFDGKSIGLRWLIRDITATKQAKQELKEAKEAAEAGIKSREEFMSVISHEIRQPMTPITALCSLLMMDKTLDEKQHKYIKIIQKNNKLLLSLVNQILDFSKISSGKIETRRKGIYG